MTSDDDPPAADPPAAQPERAPTAPAWTEPPPAVPTGPLAPPAVPAAFTAPDRAGAGPTATEPAPAIPTGDPAAPADRPGSAPSDAADHALADTLAEVGRTAEPVAWIRPPGRRPVVSLPGGGSLTFGRADQVSTVGRSAAARAATGAGRSATGSAGRSRRRADLEVSESRRVSRRAGVLEATPFGVLLTNTGSNPLLLDETGVPRLTLRPGQVHLLGEGTARIGFAGTDDALELDVLVGARPGGPPPDTDDPTTDRTRPAWTLAEGTAYFSCLVALCEPTLRHPDSPWIPTSQQVADRLWECGVLPERRTGDWVDRRLDDVREKLPIGERPWSAERARRASPEEQEQALARMRSGAPRRTGRKEQLVDFAVGYGIVTLQTVRRLLG